MLETLMTLRTIKAESSDSISFSIRSNYKNELVLTIGLSTKTEYGTSSTTNFDLLLNDFSEAIASFRADSKNLLDYSLEGIQVKESEQFLRILLHQQNLKLHLM